MTRRVREAIERSERAQHAKTCTGLKLHCFSITVDGQPLRVIDGSPCSCAKGRWIAEQGLEQAITRAARARGPAWITKAELERQHFTDAGVPMWGGIVVEP